MVADLFGGNKIQNECEVTSPSPSERGGWGEDFSVRKYDRSTRVKDGSGIPVACGGIQRTA